MGNTDETIVTLDPTMLGDLLALSHSAGWNQTKADWSMMLDAGEGWGIRDSTGGSSVIVASALALPYPPAHGWISMVLVLPSHRRRGYASQLMLRAIAALGNRGLTAWLDATDTGQAVYARLGFVGRGSFTRWARPPTASEQSCGTHTAHGVFDSDKTGAAENNDDCVISIMRPDDLPAVAAMDSESFGADRTRLLTALRERAPAFSLTARKSGVLMGFVLARDGTNATQIGPLIASQETTAQALLAAALKKMPGSSIYVDLPDRLTTLAAQLHTLGFRAQRPFLRMALGPLRNRIATPVFSGTNQAKGAAMKLSPPAISEQSNEPAEPTTATHISAFVVAGPELG